LSQIERKSYLPFFFDLYVVVAQSSSTVEAEKIGSPFDDSESDILLK